ncbi:hypothetical protein Tco_1153818 [Tanacetum coccineum]
MAIRIRVSRRINNSILGEQLCLIFGPVYESGMQKFGKCVSVSGATIINSGRERQYNSDEKELTCSSVVAANELLVADVDEDLNVNVPYLNKVSLNLRSSAKTCYKYWTTELIKKREIFEISNGGFGLLHLYSDDSSDDDILEREFESKMDKLDHKVTLLKDIKAKYNGIIRNTDLFDFAYAIEDNSNHHENQYGNDFSETDYSLNINDMSGNYNDGECSHGVEELDKNFINETDEEIGEDSSKEEMTEEVNQKVIEADIILQKSINDDIQNKEQNSIDEDFQKVSEVVCIVEKSRESNIQNEEQINLEKSREDEFNGFNVKKESSFDFKILDTPKVDDKEKSAVRGFEDCLNKGLFRQVAEPDNSIRSFETDCSQKEKQSLDRIQTVSFRPESEIDVLKEDIKPHIRDASIRLQPKREASVAWQKFTVIKLFSMVKNQISISVFDEYISKNSPERRASIFRNVEPERLKMKWRTCENELDNGVFLMSHMDNYFGEAESKWEYGFCKESNEQTKQLKFLRSKYAARILLLENNSYKDEFQKEVDKVRSKDKNTRRELIEEAVLRRPAKVDEYFG